jgi:hypothetical protein
MGFLSGVFWIVAVICAIWVIYEVATKHKHWKTGKKVVWIVLAILFSIITAIAFYFSEYKKN